MLPEGCSACLRPRPSVLFLPMTPMFRPANNVAAFITIIVKAPIVQLFSMILGFGIVALDYPAPFLKNTSVHRSFVLRVVVLLLQAFLAILYYQVRSGTSRFSPSRFDVRKLWQGTNGAIWSLVAVIGYTRAIALGETMEEAKQNRGRGGKA